MASDPRDDAASIHPTPSSGSDQRSRGSGPAIASSISAASSTLRASGPTCSIDSQPDAPGRFSSRQPGQSGTRPIDAFMPKRPQNAAGSRIDPPPSLPIAIGQIPLATAAADPALEPPGVRAKSQGLRVVGNRGL